jgi:hypothetical protein
VNDSSGGEDSIVFLFLDKWVEEYVWISVREFTLTLFRFITSDLVVMVDVGDGLSSNKVGTVISDVGD